MLKIPYGQDPYSVIGKYIREHITAIEDIIAVIEIDGITTNQLFMVDVKEESYFVWDNDWYEGEKDVALIDFFPVSEAINQSAQPEMQDDGELDFIQKHKKIPVELSVSAQPEQCEFCRNRRLEDGDTLYISADWDGGIGFDYIRNVHYCPRCGRRL